MSLGPSRAAWLGIGGPVEPWSRLGLTVVAASGADTAGGPDTVPFLDTSLRFVGGEPGIRSWALSGIDPAVELVDGLPTSCDEPTPTLVEHPLGATGLDHVVVLTDSIERTSAALEGVSGAGLRRIREVELPNGTMRQGFHRMGPGGLVVELVERPELEAGTCEFWGLVLDVTDLDAAVESLGPELIGAPKDAVQPGRRIATVRSAADLGVAVALMSV